MSDATVDAPQPTVAVSATQPTTVDSVAADDTATKTAEPPAPPAPNPGTSQPKWMWGPTGWVAVPGTPRQPRPPTTLMKHWPGATGTAPRATLVALLIAALVAAVSLVLNRPGISWLIVGVALVAVALVTSRASRAGTRTGAAPAEPAAKVSELEPAEQPDPTPGSVRQYGSVAFWTVCALALLGVGALRDAGWLFFWCVVGSIGCAAAALSGGRTVKALFLSVLTLPASVPRSLGWVSRGAVASRSQRGGPRIVATVAISLALLVVFGALFAGADAEFAHVLGSVLPTLNAAEVTRAIFCFLLIGGFACGIAFLAAARPKLDTIPPNSPRRVRRVEWVLPLALLNVLFAAFVFIQLTVLFGGDAKRLATASHAYMRGYAHSGFWQLLTVTILTLTVLGVTARVAPRVARTDRVLLRLLLGGLAVFSLVIVASAIKRVSSYEHAYGYTRLRVVVGGIEIWFGLVFVLILIAGITLRASWLPRVIVGSLAVALIAGAVANPDLYVAQQNVNRYYHTGKLSVEYMRQMSADAAPAIEQLPPNLLTCSFIDTSDRLNSRADDWRTWNYDRALARDILLNYRIPDFDNQCPNLVR